MMVSVFDRIENIVGKRENAGCQKLKKFADDNFKFDESGRKLSKLVENTVGKGEIAHYEQFLLFPQCFKRFVSQGRQKVLLCGKGLSDKTCLYLNGKHCGKRKKVLVTIFVSFSYSAFKIVLFWGGSLKSRIVWERVN